MKKKTQGKILPKKIICDLLQKQQLGFSKSRIARECNIARATVTDYVRRYEAIDLTFEEVENLHESKLYEYLGKSKPREYRHIENIDFHLVHNILSNGEKTLSDVWRQGFLDKKWQISYSHFCRRYRKWSIKEDVSPYRSYLQYSSKKAKEHHLWMKKLLHGKIRYSELERNNIDDISSKDLRILYQNIHSPKRQYRNRAITIIANLNSIPNNTIANTLLAELKTIRRYISLYKDGGVEKLLDFSHNVIKKSQDQRYIDKVFEILHSPPSLYGINRTRWEMKHIQQVMNKSGLTISQYNISKIIRNAGYRFRKAKKVLTSTDPEYQEKLELITKTLSNLGPKEKFFSIDEYGPLSIKIQGGKSLVAPGEVHTVPQWQQSKGTLIVTAALELSTNQITHFYSDKKNTKEMIKLIEKLLDIYSDDECIYISWDAASWHASQELYNKVEEVNSHQYREVNHSPIVKLVPLPARAQFLNVIESVFSGMARAIIHNSDYQSVEECQKAIDLYFDERNQNFKQNPKRAGNKIWGKERVKAKFRLSNNCKDPNWR